MPSSGRPVHAWRPTKQPPGQVVKRSAQGRLFPIHNGDKFEDLIEHQVAQTRVPPNQTCGWFFGQRHAQMTPKRLPAPARRRSRLIQATNAGVLIPFLFNPRTRFIRPCQEVQRRENGIFCKLANCRTPFSQSFARCAGVASATQPVTGRKAVR